MSRNEIIEAIVNSDIVSRYVRKFYYGSYSEDVVADLYFIILHLPQGSLERAYRSGGMTGVFRLVGGVLKRQLISTSSYIYNKYKRHEHRQHPTDKVWYSGTDDE
jgi:hypothetical protein